MPTPKTYLPPLRCWSVATSFARMTGLCVGSTSTDVPSWTRLVTAATWARVISGSVQLTR